MRIDFEKATCGRCGGSGRMPFSAYGGVCFGCNGKGENLTRAGKAAFRKVEAWAAENMMVAASSLKPGDKILDRGLRRTVVSVTTTLGKGNGRSMTGTPGTDTYSETWTYGETVIETQKVVYSGAAHRAVRRNWDDESLRAVAEVVKRYKGATITE